MNKSNEDDEEITEDGKLFCFSKKKFSYFSILLDDLELELRLARLEYLMDRRPLMLNSVLLRQNPHNVNEWLKRVKLYGEQYDKVIQTFTTAVQTVDPKICTGKLQDLWIAFAQFYDKYQQPDEARYIYDKATKVNFRNVDDLAAIWCAWCEMELQHERPDEAIKLMERATVLPKHKVIYLFYLIKTWFLYCF
jgi:pre-mRNA-splicing factor SYF1